MIKFCSDYNIILAHSTAYYPQGNGLAESSNKSIVRIIKKLLQENKRAWHTKLKFALWVEIISSKRDIGTSPFQLVYGADAVFLGSLGASVMRFIQEEEAEMNSFQRRINQLVEVKQI
jgi:transposase InsO family protein